MSENIITTSIAGATFGAALAASGVYSPSVIVSQMQLSNFHMLKVFMTASASSAVIFAAFNKIGLSDAKPRPPSSIGLFGRYDGNIIGGTMFGLGMTLTGACPGTVLVQVATGIRSGWYIFGGGIIGGMLYARYFERLRVSPGNSCSDSDLTVNDMLNIKSHHAVLAYGMLCFALISVVTALGPNVVSGPLNPLLGGALIGAAQAISLLLTRKAVGISTGYEVLGRYLWWAVDALSGINQKQDPVPLTPLYFMGAVIAGSWTLAQNISSVVLESAADVSIVRNVFGGLIMVLGARLAGGCTSGHGISGMSLLGTSSFITVLCMFVGGIGSALFI